MSRPGTVGPTLPPVREVKAPEVVRAIVVNAQEPAGVPGAVVLSDPTQVRRPWRATVRTIVQAAVALAVLFPVLVETAGLDPNSFPWLGGALLVAAAVARIMALPQLEAFLRRFVPWLAAGGH